MLDSLIYVIKLELSDGKIVRLADLGNFRLTFGSEGTETEKEFTSACIRRPKYTFVPGKALRDQAQIIKYEKYSPEIKTVIDDEPCPYPHE
ncbi:MAG: hypothetical protein LIP01_05870 [Tannerellaceae bacterium]|nr:hypothetical protein [Tannerellaceae bacterium]